MTFGGGADGIGLGGAGLGDGEGSDISMKQCNEQGYSQRENLDAESDDRFSYLVGGFLQNGLVVLVEIVKVAG